MVLHKTQINIRFELVTQPDVHSLDSIDKSQVRIRKEVCYHD